MVVEITIVTIEDKSKSYLVSGFIVIYVFRYFFVNLKVCCSENFRHSRKLRKFEYQLYVNSLPKLYHSLPKLYHILFIHVALIICRNIDIGVVFYFLIWLSLLKLVLHHYHLHRCSRQ